MGFLTGKSTQKSVSENKAYPYLQGAYGGQVTNGTGASSLLASLLGVGGTPGAGQAGLDAFKNSAGYNNVIKGGTDAITGNAASRGLLRSGSTGKAIVNFGQNTAQNFYNNYLQNLLGLSGQGLQAGGLIGNAGQTSTQTSKSKPGLAPMLGTLAAGIPSDPRLKTDVTRVGTASNGLGVYDYHYLWDEPDSELRRGYMADEVARIAPEAIAAPIRGYMTVDYSKLPPIED
jgi:hypothetical protein